MLWIKTDPRDKAPQRILWTRECKIHCGLGQKLGYSITSSWKWCREFWWFEFCSIFYHDVFRTLPLILFEWSFKTTEVRTLVRMVVGRQALVVGCWKVACHWMVEHQVEEMETVDIDWPFAWVWRQLFVDDNVPYQQVLQGILQHHNRRFAFLERMALKRIFSRFLFFDL